MVKKRVEFTDGRTAVLDLRLSDDVQAEAAKVAVQIGGKVKAIVDGDCAAIDEPWRYDRYEDLL